MKKIFRQNGVVHMTISVTKQLVSNFVRRKRDFSFVCSYSPLGELPHASIQMLNIEEEKIIRVFIHNWREQIFLYLR